MPRVPFTSQDARNLRTRRKARGISQYQLASILNWPRSKVKRLEKHEVVTIERADHQTLQKTLVSIAVDRKKTEPRRKKTKQTKNTAPKRTKPKADKGKPKPRLDYKDGTATVTKALYEAQANGKAFLYGLAIQEATGYSACQVRAFCRSLENKGALRREGSGRGMQYILLKKPTGQDPSPAKIPALPDVALPERLLPSPAAKIRARLYAARHETTKEHLLPLLRQKVTFPSWLLALTMSEGIGNLTIREVWGA